MAGVHLAPESLGGPVGLRERIVGNAVAVDLVFVCVDVVDLRFLGNARSHRRQRARGQHIIMIKERDEAPTGELERIVGSNDDPAVGDTFRDRYSGVSSGELSQKGPDLI